MLEGVFAWLLQWHAALSGLISVTLTAFLVVLYRQQRDLLKAEHQPVIDIEKFEIEDDDLIVSASNFGNGVATDLELVTVSAFQGLKSLSNGLAVSKMTRKSKESQANRTGRSIKAGEEKIDFEARVPLPIAVSNSRAQKYGFRSGVEELALEDAEVVRIHFYLRHENILEKHDISHFLSIEFEPQDERLTSQESRPTLERVSEKGAKMLSGEPSVSAENLSVDWTDAITKNERTVV